MLTQRQVELCVSSQHSAWVCELQEPPLAVVGTHTGVAGAVERRTFDHHVETYFVDASAAELLRLHDFVCPLDIFGEQIEGEPVFAFSNRIE